ncbi:glycosyltransferase [Niallia sp. 01092]|uniref:glycosyltransferase n=1 Tax=unclassified Niallia TaxID=2837522 RepID=UPI003FD0AD08
MDSAYCTILSKTRLFQFLALIISLNNVTKGNFRFYVLCVDEESYNLLKKINWENVHLYPEEELEEHILLLKKERKIHEYCWTLKSIFLETLLLKHGDINRVTYMDSDLYFWGNPEVIFEKQPACSVLLTKEEKYNPAWKKSFIKTLTKITGKYNSGFISFKRDQNSLACLKWWKEKSIESCTILFKKQVFGDQKYLDDMPILFSGICNITTPGINIGPWNYLKYSFSQQKDIVLLDKTPLIFYHFSGVRILENNEVKLVHNSESNLPFIYKMYKKVLKDVVKMVSMIDSEFDGYATEEDLKSYW